MAVTTYAGWIADGKPARQAQPIADMVTMFEGHGFVVYWMGNQAHLTATPPEDHCPFSNTPWPGAQPYPYVLALDLMPKGGAGGASLAPIARKIIADKRSGNAPWVKYLNWTDESGHVWHTKWQPTEATTASTDAGHIHLSIRTDYATSNAAHGWDPLAPPTPIEDAMANQFLAEAGGQYYLCSGDKSVKISPARANTLAYLHAEGSGSAIDLGHSPGYVNNLEWESTQDGRAGMVRKGWTPNFGPAVEDNGGVTTATITDAQVTQLATELAPQIKAGASVADIKAIINGTKLVTA